MTTEAGSDNSFNNITDRLVYRNIDALQNSLISCILIEKDKLNSTLPNYYYKNRIACATITERQCFI